VRREDHIVAGVSGYRFPADDPSHAVLVCHGMGAHGGIYDVFGGSYAQEGGDVWTLDLPGCGRTASTGGRGTFTAQQWVDATCSYAAHIRSSTGLPVVALGSSLGVMPAAAALTTSDDLTAGVFMGGAVAGIEGRPTHPFASPDGQAILAELGTTATFRIDRFINFDEDYGHSRATEEKRRDPLNTWEFDLASWASLLTYVPVVPPAKNTKPVMFAVGEHDPLMPPSVVRSVAEQFGGPVEIFELPGGVHQLMLFHTAEFTNAVLSFVARTVLAPATPSERADL
jgi:alpha-beta hydrolase superfamily lysophospholipase